MVIDCSYTIKLSKSELNTLRCFIEDALAKGAWGDFPKERDAFLTLHDQLYSAMNFSKRFNLAPLDRDDHETATEA